MLTYSICILTYSNVEGAKSCIRSILANSPPVEFELILTANGNPEAEKYFQALGGIPVTVVSNPRNEGFIEPTRHALTLAKGEYFILLNDDAIVPPGWLAALRLPFDTDPRCALSAPKGGCCVIDASMNGHPSHGAPEYLEGACLMGRTAFLREFGLWDPELSWAYWEDVDLSLRVREAGHSIRFSDFRIQHERGTTSKHLPDTLAYQRKNAGYIHKRWGHYLKHRTFEYPTILRRRAAHGDTLLLTPVISRLRELRPCSPIWVETECWEVLSNNPKVAKFFPRITDAQIPASAQVIDLNMAYENRTQVHIVDAYADACKVVLTERRTEIYPTASDLAWAMRTLPGDDWVAIHPGPTTWKGKNWPMDRWAAVSAELSARGHKVVLVGPADHAVIPNDLDLRGHTTVLQMAAVLRFVRIFVGVDSLPLHVSQAVGTPVVGLFGATSPEFILTAGSHGIGVVGTTACAGERHRVKGATSVPCDGACMRSIEVTRVMEAVEGVLVGV